VQNSNSSYDSSVLDENCSGDDSETESHSGIFAITNQNFDITCNIEAWRNNATLEEEEEEEEEKIQSEQAKSDCSLTRTKRKKKTIFPKSTRRMKSEATLTLRKRQLFPITPLYSRRFTGTLVVVVSGKFRIYTNIIYIYTPHSITASK